MKVHKRTIKGHKVEAYNDSGCDWVVSVNGVRGAWSRVPAKGNPASKGRGGMTLNNAIEFCVSCYESLEYKKEVA